MSFVRCCCCNQPTDRPACLETNESASLSSSTGCYQAMDGTERAGQSVTHSIHYTNASFTQSRAAHQPSHHVLKILKIWRNLKCMSSNGGGDRIQYYSGIRRTSLSSLALVMLRLTLARASAAAARRSLSAHSPLPASVSATTTSHRSFNSTPLQFDTYPSLRTPACKAAPQRSTVLRAVLP